MRSKKNSAIPEIDLLPLWNDPLNGVNKIALEINHSFKDIGFAYLKNHNISSELVQAVFKAAEDFHNLPLDVKMKIKQNECFRGYMPINASQLKVSTQGKATQPNQLESFIMAFDPPLSCPDYKTGAYLAGPNQWLEENDLPSFKETVLNYRDAMMVLTHKLLEVFAVAFGLSSNGLNSFFINPSYFLRLQCYPSQPKNIPEDQFGIAPHTDYGFFTILAQDDVGGLTIKQGEDWVEIPCEPGTLVLNAGDMMKRWTNNYFQSLPHYVINKSPQKRFSIPFFFEPNMYANIETLKTFTHTDPSKYPAVMYGDYLLDRVQGNYGLGKRN